MKKILFSLFVSVVVASCGVGNKYSGSTSVPTPDICFDTIEVAPDSLSIVKFESTLAVCQNKVLNIPATRESDGKKYVSIASFNLGYGVFESNDFIETIIGGANLESIGDSAFRFSFALVNVDLPKVKSIGQYSFASGSSQFPRKLSSVNLPSLESVGMAAFFRAESLININIPKVTTIGNAAFFGANSLTNIDLPEATLLGNQAFFVAESLININIPKVTKINLLAFKGSLSLTSINLPKIINIGSNAFESTISLTQITIGESLESIGSNVFMTGPEASKRTFIMLGTKPPTTIYAGAFGLVGSNIYVPSEAAVTAWKGSTIKEFDRYESWVKVRP